MNEKEKRRQHRKEKKQKAHNAPSAAPSLEMPPHFLMEQVMRSMFGGGGSDPDSEAQDLAYKAIKATTQQEALKFARQALEKNLAASTRC